MVWCLILDLVFVVGYLGISFVVTPINSVGFVFLFCLFLYGCVCSLFG